jgi:hypothetical protein
MKAFRLSAIAAGSDASASTPRTCTKPYVSSSVRIRLLPRAVAASNDTAADSATTAARRRSSMSRAVASVPAARGGRAGRERDAGVVATAGARARSHAGRRATSELRRAMRIVPLLRAHEDTLHHGSRPQPLAMSRQSSHAARSFSSARCGVR